MSALKRRGLTLAEVLIGMSLLSLLLVLAAGILHWALVGSEFQQRQTIAAFLAQQKLEEVLQQNPPLSTQGQFSAPYASFTWTARVEHLREGPFLQLDLEIQDSGKSLYRLSTQRRLQQRRLTFRQGTCLYSISEDRPQATLVSQDLRHDYAVSPDQETLAWVQMWKGRPQIFRRRLSESEGQVWIEQPGGAQEPCFSADGQKLAFTSLVAGRSQVLIHSSKGIERASQSGHQDTNPEFTPDGRGLVVCRDQFSIVLLRAGQEKPLVESNKGWNTSPHFSPDGSTLVFMSNRDGNPEIYRLDLASKRLQRLTQNPAHDSQPRYSADGYRILFCRRQADSSRIFSMNPDGSQVSEITPDQEGEEPRWLP